MIVPPLLRELPNFIQAFRYPIIGNVVHVSAGVEWAELKSDRWGVLIPQIGTSFGANVHSGQFDV